MSEVHKLGNIYNSEHKGGSFAGNVYSTDNLCPTLNSMGDGGERVPMIVEEININKDITPIRLGNMYGDKFGTGMAGNAWSIDTISPTIKCEGGGGNRVPMIIELTEPVPVASKGRNPEDPNNREAGIHLEQRLEINTTGTSNTITSVAKDNWVLEPPKEKRYRIRKLTEKETWRLMDFSDEDYEKAAEVNVRTNLLKQSGNAIVRNCLVAIFGQMFEGKEDIYKNTCTV